MLKRSVIAASVIVVVSAMATTSSALLFFDQTVQKFTRVNTGHELTPVLSGKPQTILIAGSDRRHGDKKLGLKPRSDTIMLMRVDPGKGVALMSLPRDLKVDIPGHGSDKINAAYEIGGPKLTIKTVKQLTGLAVNHYVDVSFHGFGQGVDALGCVYVDVDRRYFNDNAGLGYGQNYAVINVQPGYQKLCGEKALEYVRYRHTDNDLVRSARQQDFLRQVRSQISASKLIGKTQKLINIFADNTASDIHSTSALRRLVALMLGVVNKPIKQVKFHGRLGPSYVTASPAQIQAAVRQFLYLRPEKGPLSRQRTRAPYARRSGGRKSGGGLNLIDVTSTSKAQAQIARPHVGFPVYYPKRLVPGSSFTEDAPRTYTIEAPGNHRYRAYKMVVFTGYIGEYYGVMGTSWPDPPILKSSSETRTYGRRQLLLFYNGDRLRLVGWKTRRGSYWVSNTLLQTLSAREMIGIARSLKAFHK
jgi:polyisoprenyl-teichoic acid--peptidoglycan teichoic acid transferase